jgi:hypothetical protein
VLWRRGRLNVGALQRSASLDARLAQARTTISKVLGRKRLAHPRHADMVQGPPHFHAAHCTAFRELEAHQTSKHTRLPVFQPKSLAGREVEKLKGGCGSAVLRRSLRTELSLDSVVGYTSLHMVQKMCQHPRTTTYKYKTHLVYHGGAWKNVPRHAV